MHPSTLLRTCLLAAMVGFAGCDPPPGAPGAANEPAHSPPAAAAPAAPSRAEAAAPPAAPAAAASSARQPAPTVDAAAGDAALPPLQVVPAVLDLGFLAPRIGGKGTLTLTNTGTVPLTIAAVTPSCKCTTTSALAGKVIAPGASETMEAVLEGAAMPQTHRASIKIAVEGYAGVLEVQLRGETTNPVRCVPSIINAVEGKPRSGRFVVESIDRKPFRICAIGGRAPEYVGFAPGEAPRAQYLVKYDLDSWDPEFPAYLAIETDREDCPLLDIWVRNERTIPQSTFRMKDYRANAGRIDLGGSRDIKLEMDDPGEDIVAIEPRSGDAALEIIGQESRAGTRTVTVRVTPRTPRSGLLYVPFAIFAREREQLLTLFASVRPAGAEGCSGCEGLPAPAPGAQAPGADRDAGALRDLSAPGAR